MSIDIIATRIVEIPGGESTRAADFVIGDGVDSYSWGAGGLPLEGDLQTILEARYDEFWAVASIAAQPVEPPQQAVVDFMALPDWASWTGQEASDYIHNQILDGQTVQEIETWINTSVTTLATAKTALIVAGQEIVELRDICQRMAQSIVYLRDIVIQRWE